MLVAMLLLFSGPAGLAVCGVAALLGSVPPLSGVRRVHLMGAILLPVIVYFLGAGTAVMAFLGL
jgi:TctA family transporter